VTKKEYTAEAIQILEGLEAVRKRPSMYIGNTDIGGLHHLVFEVVDNSVDEALAGFCTEITVTIHRDGSVSVLDNGRGIPVDIHRGAGKPALEVVLTTLHAGGKFESGAYTISGGLHGVGISVVNALSEWLEVEVKTQGRIWHQRYERGKPVTPLRSLGETEETGTFVRFKPDPLIFSQTEFHFDIIAQRLKELAFLNPGLTLSLADERSGKQKVYSFSGGIRALVEHLNQGEGCASSRADFLFWEPERHPGRNRPPVQRWVPGDSALFCQQYPY